MSRLFTWLWETQPASFVELKRQWLNNDFTAGWEPVPC